MSKHVYITIDLEPDYAGYGPDKYLCWNENNINKLLSLFKKHSVKPSIFVVAKSLKNKNIIKKFQQIKSEFHLHSWSHDIKDPDSLKEVSIGQKVFKKFFGYKPIGYRAPLGLITPTGLKNLKSKKFLFDSSVFPSFWPNISHFLKPNRPYIDKNSKILEIPVSTISPFRFLMTLSWFKLLGWNFYSLLLSNFTLSDNIVFGLHLHDVFETSSKNRLPFFWKIRYLNNKDHGFEFLDKFLICIKRRGYDFSTVGLLAVEKSLELDKELYYNNIGGILSDKISKIETKKRLDVVFGKLLDNKLLKDKKFLEVGVGSGDFSKRALSLCANITGVDVGPDLINKLNKNVPKGNFILANGAKLPFKNNLFDIVLCTQVLRHVSDPLTVLSELTRVVKKGGLVVITTPNKLYKPLAVILGKIQKYNGNENWYYPWEIKKIILNLGLELQHEYNFMPFKLPSTLSLIERAPILAPLMLDCGLVFRK